MSKSEMSAGNPRHCRSETSASSLRVSSITLPREALVARLNGRATAEHRADDTPEIIANRLDVYEEQTRPVISYYEDRGLVKRVSGLGSVADVSARLREAAE